MNSRIKESLLGSRNINKKRTMVGSMVFLILSLLDGALTIWGLGLSAIVEINPVMKWLVERSPILFMAVKLLLPVILGCVLWKIPERSDSFFTYSLGFVLVVYSVTMVLHFYWILDYVFKNI